MRGERLAEIKAKMVFFREVLALPGENNI